MLLLGVGEVALGLVLVILGDRWFTRSIRIWNVAIGLFLGWVGIRMWRGDPVITLKDDGIVHPRAGFITWDEIESLPIHEGGHGRFLVMKTRDEREVTVSADPASMTPEELRFMIEGRAGRTYPHDPDG
jgi:hypothetical protein